MCGFIEYCLLRLAGFPVSLLSTRACAHLELPRLAGSLGFCLLILFSCFVCVHVGAIRARSRRFQQTVATIVPLLDALSKDSEPVVKQHLVEQLKHLAKFFFEKGGADGYRLLLEKLLPITAHLLEDEKQEVRQSASMTMVEIAQLVKVEDIGQYVLTVILVRTHSLTHAPIFPPLSSLLAHSLPCAAARIPAAPDPYLTLLCLRYFPAFLVVSSALRTRTRRRTCE